MNMESELASLRAERENLCEQSYSLALALADPEMQLASEEQARRRLEETERAVLERLDTVERVLRTN